MSIVSKSKIRLKFIVKLNLTYYNNYNVVTDVGHKLNNYISHHKIINICSYKKYRLNLKNLVIITFITKYLE